MYFILLNLNSLPLVDFWPGVCYYRDVGVVCHPDRSPYEVRGEAEGSLSAKL